MKNWIVIPLPAVPPIMLHLSDANRYCAFPTRSC